VTNTETSRASYHQLPPAQEPSEAEMCLAIFQGKPHLVFSHRDIAIATGLGINKSESRCSYLVKKHKIEYAGRYYDFFTKRDVQKYRFAKHKKKTSPNSSTAKRRTEP
jgi:hypothetical protein